VPRVSGLSGLIDQILPAESAILEDFLERLQALRSEGRLSENLPERPGEQEAEQAIRHALQLYDAASVRKLVANYDPEQSPTLLRGSVLKSLRSLGVAKRLESFGANDVQHAHLLRYQHHLQVSLTRLLGREVSSGWERSWLIGHLENLAATAPEKARRFFEERYRELFSEPYWTYLTLKHRYYQGLLHDHLKNATPPGALETLWAKFSGAGQPLTLREWTDQTDFREMELFVRKARSLLAKQQGRLLAGMDEASAEEEAAPLLKSGGAAPDLNERFRQWLQDHHAVLQRLEKSFKAIPECSAPYFFPQVSAYQPEAHDLLQRQLGCQPDEFAELPGTLAQILGCSDEEALDSRRIEWGLMPESLSENSGLALLENHRERSRIHAFKLPWAVRHQTDDSTISLPAGMGGLLHYGLACFGQTTDTAPSVQAGIMLRLLVQGTKIGGGSRVVHVGKRPFFAVPLETLGAFRGVLLSAMVVLLLRHQIEVPASFQQLILRECRMGDATQPELKP